ncbi:MAG: adenosyl-hopene transferase HpnH [Planctomycetes bacterium]|nr:adenosyl-hopene transferase HpnH [Planctomycetota bacterium]
MVVPLIQKYRIAKYLLGKRLRGEKRYPLVLMLEPLFRCNLACAGCGKIDYPEHILQRRLSIDECLQAVDECGAPVVSIPGGEPLIHPEMPEIVAGIVRRKKFVYLCTNGILLERHLDRYRPSPYLTFSVHLDGLREEHDAAVCRDGVFDKAVSAIRAARARGFRVTVNCTLFDSAAPERTAEFFDHAMELGVEGISVSPGFRYERAPRQDVFLRRNASKELFRDVFRLGHRRGRKWRFNHSSLFLDFLAGNQSYECTPWGNPTRNIFGWQRPCYLLVSEGYASTFAELMQETDWDRYGVGRHDKCEQCQMHCGFEPTAVEDAFRNPLKALRVAFRGPRTEGPFATDPLEAPRPAPTGAPLGFPAAEEPA